MENKPKLKKGPRGPREKGWLALFRAAPVGSTIAIVGKPAKNAIATAHLTGREIEVKESMVVSNYYLTSESPVTVKGCLVKFIK